MDLGPGGAVVPVWELECPSGECLVGGAHVRNECAVVVVGVALAVFDDVAAVGSPQRLGVSVAAGVGEPLDDEEAAFARFDVFQQDERQVFGGVVPGLARLGFARRIADRRGVWDRGAVMRLSCQCRAGRGGVPASCGRVSCWWRAGRTEDFDALLVSE